MKDRIKYLRKDLLKMTLEQFGAKIGMKKNSLSQVENGINSVTDQVVLAICREFNVSEAWLRTGEGEPFVKKSRSDEIRDYVDRIQGVNDTFKAQFAAALAALEEEDWGIILDVVNDIKNRSMAEKKRAMSAPVPTAITDLTPEEQEVIRQLREKKRLAAESEDSSSGKRDMA